MEIANPDFEKMVRGIVSIVQPSAEDWEIVSCGDIVSELPAREETMEEMVLANHVDGYRHYQPGNDLYIMVGTIHLHRPVAG
jgi:hypothetical protein